MNGLLGSRRLLAVAGVLLVVGLLAVLARHVGGSAGAVRPVVHPSAVAVSPSPSVPVVAPSAPVGASDEGAVSDPSPSPARITDGEPDPKTFGINFFATYLNTINKGPGEWRATWHDLVTPELAAELADVDPSSVPVGRFHDADVRAFPEGDALYTVVIPVTGVGVATLTLTGGSGRWLVSQLDWARLR